MCEPALGVATPPLYKDKQTMKGESQIVNECPYNLDTTKQNKIPALSNGGSTIDAGTGNFNSGRHFDATMIWCDVRPIQYECNDPRAPEIYLN